jgi:hypothetical protein
MGPLQTQLRQLVDDTLAGSTDFDNVTDIRNIRDPTRDTRLAIAAIRGVELIAKELDDLKAARS